VEADQPYRPPLSELGGPSVGDSGSITPRTIEVLKKTRPWTLFAGIMMLIACGFMAVAALLVMAFGGAMANGMGPMGGVLLGGVYLVFAALYVYPAIRLVRFSGAIKRIGGGDSAGAIEDALTQQLGLWRFVGIVMIAMLAAYILIIGVAIVVGVFSSLGS